MNWKCLIALMVISIVGCGRAAPKPAGEQGQISGTVTNDGKPIPANCQVTFINKDKGATLGTNVDAAGKFTLVGADPKIGIPTGHYRVSVLPPAPKAVLMSDPDYSKYMQSGPPKLDPAMSAMIPEKFRINEKSPLEFDVKAGPNEFTIDLSKF